MVALCLQLNFKHYIEFGIFYMKVIISNWLNKNFLFKALFEIEFWTSKNSFFHLLSASIARCRKQSRDRWWQEGGSQCTFRFHGYIHLFGMFRCWRSYLHPSTKVERLLHSWSNYGWCDLWTRLFCSRSPQLGRSAQTVFPECPRKRSPPARRCLCHRRGSSDWSLRQ